MTDTPPILNVNGEPIPDMNKLVLDGTLVEDENEPGTYYLTDQYYRDEHGNIFPSDYFITERKAF